MIASRAPLRVSYAGGGTDLAAYYTEHEGVVLSAAVSLYTHVSLAPVPAGCEVSSLDYHAEWRCDGPDGVPDETPFRLARAALAEIGLPPDWTGIRMVTSSDVSPGTGLGASCSMVVALCSALLAARGSRLSPGELAEMAYRVDTDRAGMSSGKQDHYAAAYGGLNIFTFRRDGVTAEQLPTEASWARDLESWTMLFYDGRRRDAQEMLRQQGDLSQSAPATLDALDDIKRLAYEMIDALRAGDLVAVGGLMDASWQAKQRVSGAIGSPHIASAYSRAREAGALGGKIAGAGASGHLVLLCEPARQSDVVAELVAEGWAHVPVEYAPTGASTSDIEKEDA